MADQFPSMSALRASFGPPVEACILSMKQSNCKPQVLSLLGTDQPRDVRHLRSCSALIVQASRTYLDVRQGRETENRVNIGEVGSVALFLEEDSQYMIIVIYI